jgi:hypothetical protein
LTSFSRDSAGTVVVGRSGVILKRWRKLRSWALTGTPPHATSLASNSDGREEAAPKRALMKSASGRAAQRKRREEAPQETEARRVEQPALKVNGV